MNLDLLKIDNILKYVIAFCVGTFIIVYLLKIPNLLTGANKLIKEYYYDNFTNSLLLDIVLIFIYLLIGMYIIKIKKMNNCTLFKKLIIIFSVSFIISFIFYIIFINKPKNEMFFSRWFHKVGIKAGIYDGIIVSTIYFIYNYLQYI
jgi:hypothetical protein